jgi:hypothetical protein
LPRIRSGRPVLVGNEAAQIRAGFDQPVFAEGDNQDGGDCWLEEGVTPNGAAQELNATGEDGGVRLGAKPSSSAKHH